MLFGFLSGLALGYVAHPAPRARPVPAGMAEVDFSSPIAVYRPVTPEESPAPLVLTPHAGVTRGVAVRYAEPPEGKPVWVVALDRSRVVLGCTEAGR